MFKNIKRTLSLLVLFAVGATFSIMESCKHTNGDCKGENKTSSANEDESHNMGQNCISCHYAGGKGEGCFTIGGTVYDSLQSTPKTGGTLKLYDGPNGSGNLVLTLEVDKKGNFYTGQTINFIGGLYPAITNKNGQTKYMSSSIPTGACGSCHGVSTGKVWVP
jgi:cytochrome c553